MALATPPVSKADVERSIPNYRQQIRRSLPDHIFKPDYLNLLWIPVHLAIFATGIWLLTNHFSLWAAPIIALVMGHSMACMGFVAHDISHGGSIKNLAVRDTLALIGFSWLGISPLLWRKWHNADHHNNTQIKGVDPDHLFMLEDCKHNPILKFLYIIHPVLRNLIIFGSFTFRMSQQQIRMVIVYLRDKDTSAVEKLCILGQATLGVGLWVAATLPFGTQVFVWGYFVPLLVGNFIAISYIATNHFLNPLADENDILATSLTVTLPRGLKWLDPWHQYFGAHVAHHLFPTVSGRHTRLIEEKARELFPDRYHSMSIFKALQMLWKTPWVYEDHTTFIDPVRDIREKTLGHGMEDKHKL